MSASEKTGSVSRGEVWFDLFAGDFSPRVGLCPSVKVSDGMMDDRAIRVIAVVPDARNPYPRAVKGEVGLLEGWTIGKAVAEVVAKDREKEKKRIILAVIDVPSQAYGRREEAFGIHLALAAAAGAYATARQAGHPVIGLIVGKAMSGAFLAHGYQANRLVALNDGEVMIHAMGKASAARITRRTVESLEELASTILPMAYDVASYQTLGLLEALVDVADPLHPTDVEVQAVRMAVSRAVDAAVAGGSSLSNRLGSPNRAGTARVYELMQRQWQV